MIVPKTVPNECLGEQSGMNINGVVFGIDKNAREKSEEELHSIACHQDGGTDGFRRQRQKGRRLRTSPRVGGYWVIPPSPWVMCSEAWEPSGLL